MLRGISGFLCFSRNFCLRTCGLDRKHPFTGGAEVHVGTLEGMLGWGLDGTEGG
jgi:hypothetical protein